MEATITRPTIEELHAALEGWRSQLRTLEEELEDPDVERLVSKIRGRQTLKHDPEIGGEG